MAGNGDTDAARAELVNGLRQKGIRDERVLGAIGAVPRHLFVPEAQRLRAYADIALPLAEGQTISQPYTVAFQTEQLRVHPGHKVLEVGTGSGYQAAILGRLGVRLLTIERIAALHRRMPPPGLEDWFPGVRFLYGDGWAGYPPEAPYDRILVTAAADTLPQVLLRQMAVSGIMILPLGRQGSVQEMTRVVRTGADSWQEEGLGGFTFVPMVHGLC